MYGWRGKVLRVDLTRGVVREESLDLRIAKDFIGGRGFGIQRLLAEVDPACDPLGPENVLIMAAGPLTGTKAPTGGRYMVTTKSPLTGSITCSNAAYRLHNLFQLGRTLSRGAEKGRRRYDLFSRPGRRTGLPLD